MIIIPYFWLNILIPLGPGRKLLISCRKKIPLLTCILVETAYCIGTGIINTGRVSLPVYFRPFRPRFKQANLRLGEFQCLQLSLFKHNIVFANLRLSESVSNWRRAKITLSENNPVYNISFYLLVIIVHQDEKVSKDEWVQMWSDCLQSVKHGKPFPEWQQRFMQFMFEVNDKSGSC